MAAKKKVAKAGAKAGKTAAKARTNPYVQRIVDDEDLRDNLVAAYEAARAAYERLSNGKSPTKQIFDDKKLQKDIKKAASNVRDASVALHEAPKKSGGLSLKRLVVLGAVGGGIALAVSEGLRKKVLDTALEASPNGRLLVRGRRSPGYARRTDAS